MNRKHLSAGVLGWSFFVLCLGPALYAAQNDWTGGGNGYWTNDNHWSLVTAPGNTDFVTITNASSAYDVTIDSGTPAGNLTISNLLVGFGSLTAPTQTLFITDAAAPFFVNHVTNTLTLVNYSGAIVVSNSTFQIQQHRGASESVVLGRLIVGSNSLVHVFNTGSDRGLNIQHGGQAFFDNATVVITNGVNGKLRVGVSSASVRLSTVSATNTLFRTELIEMSAGARVFIDNTANTNLNDVRGFFFSGQNSRSGTVATVVGGRYNASITMFNNAHFTNIGATITRAQQSIVIGRSGGGADVEAADYVVIGGTNLLTGINGGNSEVSLGAGNFVNGFGVTGRMHQVSGLLNANALNLGQVSNSVGVFQMDGGTVVLTNFFFNTIYDRNALKVGSTYGKGLYAQDGGSVFAGEVRLGAGAEQFQVGSTATLTVIGSNGFVSAAPITSSNAFDFAGTLVFAPRGNVLTQQLTLAGQYLGGNTDGYSNNFSLGTLDLSAFSPSNRLQLTAPAGVLDAALYVGTISPIATGALASALTVFYLPELNQSLYFGAPQGIYALEGGGFLMPIPEPSALVCMIATACLFLSRRRQR